MAVFALVRFIITLGTGYAPGYAPALLSRIRVDVSDPTDDLCAILGSSSSAYSDYRYDMIESRDDKEELRGFAHGFNTRRHEKLLGIRRNEKKFKTDLRNSYLASIGN